MIIKTIMNISVFGLGYVGCISLGCLSSNGHKVIGVDISLSKVDKINNGRPTIIENDIDKIINKSHKLGLISATLDSKYAINNSEISIICVGTPSTREGHLDLSHIFNVTRQIAETLKTKKKFHTIAIRSTVAPGTNEKVSLLIEEISGKTANKDFAVVSNPEFLREGTAVSDYYNPEVTVLGTNCDTAFQIMTELYKNINAPIKRTEIKVAEIIKYVNNSFHALKISFANEIGNICKAENIDSHDVMDLFIMDTKLNLSSCYLRPGFAYGGSCLTKDLKGLKTIAHDHYIESPVLESIERSNDIQKDIAFKLITSYRKRHIGILGLSFKAGTDDLRYSPIVDVTEMLIGKGYKIFIYDENIEISRLTGTNKESIDKHIPHLSDLLNNDLLYVINSSELIVITHNLPVISNLIKQYPNKIFIDLVRISNSKYNNLEGICW